MNKLKQLFRKCEWCKRTTGDVKHYTIVSNVTLMAVVPAGKRVYCKACYHEYHKYTDTTTLREEISND